MSDDQNLKMNKCSSLTAADINSLNNSYLPIVKLWYSTYNKYLITLADEWWELSDPSFPILKFGLILKLLRIGWMLWRSFLSIIIRQMRMNNYLLNILWLIDELFKACSFVILESSRERSYSFWEYFLEFYSSFCVLQTIRSPQRYYWIYWSNSIFLPL